jgi:hypothetical protein
MVQLFHTCMIANEFSNFKKLFQEKVENINKKYQMQLNWASALQERLNHAKTILFNRLIIWIWHNLLNQRLEICNLLPTILFYLISYMLLNMMLGLVVDPRRPLTHTIK